MARRTTLMQHLLTLRNHSTAEMIRVLRSKNLLLSAIKCPECNKLMAERERANHVDGFRWRCMSRECPKYECSVSIRHGSFFADYRLPIVDIWTIIVC